LDPTIGFAQKHLQELMRDAPGGTAWFAPPGLLAKQGNVPWHDRKAPGKSKFTKAQQKQVLDRILAVLLGRSFAVAENGVCEPSDLNWLIRIALGFKDGMLDYGHQLGADRVAELCLNFQKAHPDFPVPKCIIQKKLPAYLRDVRIERDGNIGIVTLPGDVAQLQITSDDSIYDTLPQPKTVAFSGDAWKAPYVLSVAVQPAAAGASDATPTSWRTPRARS
jgi:hypothetical protein